MTVTDTEAPTFSWSDPVDQSSNPTQGGAVVLRAAFADASGIRSITVYDQDENFLDTYYSSQFERDLGSLTEGSYRYKLVAEDNNGNGTTKWVEFTEYYPAPGDVDLGLDENEQQGGGGLVGARVRIFNGNTIESRTDLSFPSPNRMGLGMSAYYNSRSSVSGVMGFGWSHTYEESLSSSYTFGTMTLLRIMDQTGRARYFKEDIPGHYKGFFKEKSYVTLESGQYFWHRLDGSLSCFSLSGRLEWVEDEKGNRINLTYNAQEKVDTVTDVASGRVLTLHYNENGRLACISGPVTTAVPDGLWVKTYGYDANGNLTSVTYADDSGFTYAYEDGNDVHNLTEKRDKASHLLANWGYDASDRVITNFSVDGKGAGIEYASGTQVNVSDAYNVIRSYTIGNIMGRKRVTALTGTAPAPYSDNSIVNWAYDQEEMRLEQVTTAGDAIHRYEDYDSKGNPGTVRLASGTALERVITYTYHPVMNVPLSSSETTTIGEPGNKVTVWDYDSDYNTTPNENPTQLLSRLVETGLTTDGSGNVVPYNYVTILTYNGKGQVLAIDGPRSGAADTTTYTYNAITGDLLTVVRPLIGNTTLSDHDAAGRPGTLTDENNRSKTFTYDGRSRITSITNVVDGRSTAITYNTAGQPDAMTDPDQVTQTFVYDTNYGRLSQIVDEEGNYIQYQYDTQGNRTEMSKHDPSGLRTSRKRWSYQHPLVPGKLWKEINADDSYTEYGYDSDGNVSSVKNPEEFTTTYAYDLLNRLIQVTQPGSVITGYGYDLHGNLASVTDAENHQTTYVYDDMGRLVETQSPDTGIVSYGYDEAGNLTSKLDAKVLNVTYTHDALNRLTAVQFPDPAQNITYTYDSGTDGKGHLTGMTDQSGTMTLSYDSRGRLFQKATNIDGQQYIYSQTYTPGDKLLHVTYPSGRTLDYTRDSMKRMQGLSTTYESSTVNLVSNMTHKPFGGPKGMTTGAGGVVDNQAGECDCITVANPGTQMEQQYTYDRNRNLLSIVAPNSPQFSQTFTYDSLNRLATAQGRYGSIGYTYDKVGNRLTEITNGQTDNYAYFSNTNRLQEITGANPLSFTYDANGNITGIGTKTLAYNQDNRLVQVTDSGITLGAYTYNSKGERVKKVAGGNTTIYHYDFDGKLIAESTATGFMLKEYLYMGQIRIAMVDVAPHRMTYYLNDRLGTSQMMTDNNSKAVWEGIYKPFGEASVHPLSTVVNNIRFPGQYYDSETGLHYNYHRYYQPRTGKYLTPDPIGLLGGINLYVYVENDSLNRADPKGLRPPAVVPPWVNVQANMQEAARMSGREFVAALMTGGKWDFKQDSPKQDPTAYADFGNYHYGLVASAFGWDPGNILRGAGLFQHLTDFNRFLQGKPRIGEGFFLGDPPCGDTVNDQNWIMEGIKDYLANHYGSSPEKQIDFEAFRELLP